MKHFAGIGPLGMLHFRLISSEFFTVRLRSSGGKGLTEKQKEIISTWRLLKFSSGPYQKLGTLTNRSLQDKLGGSRLFTIMRIKIKAACQPRLVY